MGDFGFHSHGGAAGRLNINAAMTGAEAKSDARKTQTEVQSLECEVERLYMVTEALWLMLKESGKFTEDDLIERVTEIDLRDGKLDGKDSTKSEPAVCPECERVMKRHRPQCLYCGTMVLKNPFER